MLRRGCSLGRAAFNALGERAAPWQGFDAWRDTAAIPRLGNRETSIAARAPRSGKPLVSLPSAACRIFDPEAGVDDGRCIIVGGIELRPVQAAIDRRVGGRRVGHGLKTLGIDGEIPCRANCARNGSDFVPARTAHMSIARGVL